MIPGRYRGKTHPYNTRTILPEVVGRGSDGITQFRLPWMAARRGNGLFPSLEPVEVLWKGRSIWLFAINGWRIAETYQRRPE